MARHVQKGDMVIVISGDGSKQKLADGRTVRDFTPHRVLRVLTDQNKVIVEGVNVHAKHVRPTQTTPRGGTIEKEMPIHLSNVQPIADGKPTRVRFQRAKDGSKIRISVRNGQPLGEPLKKV